MSTWAGGRRSSASAMAEKPRARGAKSASDKAENAGVWATKAEASARGAKAEKTGAQDKKRVALGNLTNVVGRRVGAARGAAGEKLSSTSTVADVKKGNLASLSNVNRKWNSVTSVTKPTFDQFDGAISHHDNVLQKKTVCCPSVPNIEPKMAPNGSLPHLSEDSGSIEEDMPTCILTESPDPECLNDGDSSGAASMHRWVNDKLHISDNKDIAVSNWRMHGSTAMGIENIFDIDNNHADPQLCASLACDIYKHLREAETKRRPSTDFMKTTQQDIDTSMRAVLIDWLVEVTEEYRLVPETLFLTVNYIDRYLSRREISRDSLQLLGVACLLIAAKYEEICPPQVEELCYVTDNTYTKDQVLQMEASVLSYLKFEMTAPTAKCFLRRFTRVAQVCHEGHDLHLEFLANCIAELSLLEYSLLCYVPSLVAASCIFLANFILKPTKNPWNSTLSYYTQYKPSTLHDCVKVLHRLFCAGAGSNLPAIRTKYSQHKYKFVAKRYCPPSIPIEFFQDASS